MLLSKLISEASVTSEQSAIQSAQNIASLLQKRGHSISTNLNAIDTFKKRSGIYLGLKYVSPEGYAVRFNWTKGSNTLVEVDVFHDFEAQPRHTLETEGLNFVQVFKALDQHLKSGAMEVDISDTKEQQEYKAAMINEGFLGNVVAKFKKAEKEVDVVKKETTEEVNSLIFEESTGDEVFERIDLLTDEVTKPSSSTYLVLVAGMPGVGKTVTVKNRLKKNCGSQQAPRFMSIPPEEKKIMLKDREKMSHVLQQMETLKKPFRAAWAEGSARTYAQFYSELWKYNGMIILYDDTGDQLLGDPQCRELLNRALDNKENRTVFYGSRLPYVEIPDVGIIPKQFQFTGRVVMISNKKLANIPGSIMSRSDAVDVYLTPDQILDRLETILPRIQSIETPNIDISNYNRVFEFLQFIMIQKKALDVFDFRFVPKLAKESSRYEDDSAFRRVAANIIKDKYPNAKIKFVRKKKPAQPQPEQQAE